MRARVPQDSTDLDVLRATPARLVTYSRGVEAILELYRPPMVALHRGAGVSPAVYRPRRPTETPLYPVVLHHLEPFLAEAQDADPMGWGVPTWVERDFRDHASRGARLRCGILAHGFARLRCTDCGHDRLLAFSCKGRLINGLNAELLPLVRAGVPFSDGEQVERDDHHHVEREAA